MKKKNITYLENAYLSLLDRSKFSKNQNDMESAKDAREDIEKFITDCDNAKLLQANTYEDKKNKEAREKFARENSYSVKSFLNGEVSENQEIDRVKRNRRYRRAKIVTPIVLVGLFAAIIGGAAACNKKTNGNSSDVTTITTIGIDEETSTMSTSDYTNESTTSGFYDGYDNSNAIPSMSEGMSGIVINDPTVTPTTVNGGNGTPATTGSTTVPTTNNTTGTPATEATTTPTTTVAPTATPTSTPTATPTPVPYVGDDAVPTTEPITPSNTEPNPSDARNMPDIVVDEYDGVQPIYIEENPNETYETYIDITPTTSVASTSSTTSNTQTYGGMVIDEDEDETYETFIEIDSDGQIVKQSKNNVKRLTLYRK